MRVLTTYDDESRTDPDETSSGVGDSCGRGLGHGEGSGRAGRVLGRVGMGNAFGRGGEYGIPSPGHGFGPIQENVWPL